MMIMPKKIKRLPLEKKQEILDYWARKASVSGGWQPLEWKRAANKIYGIIDNNPRKQAIEILKRKHENNRRMASSSYYRVAISQLEYGDVE